MCPLCSAAFDAGEPYRDHLEEAHGLSDDEGTATVTQLHANRIGDEAAMSLVAEAVLDAQILDAQILDAPFLDAPSSAGPESPAATGTSPAAVPVAAAKSDTTSPPSRYPLATRHGDVALYAPGVVMLLTAVVRLDADVLGLLLLLLGTALVVLGMLVPLVLGRS